MLRIAILIVFVFTGALAHGEAPEGIYSGDGMELWFEEDTWIIFMGYDVMGEAMVDYGYWEERPDDNYNERTFLLYQDNGYLAYIFEPNGQFSYLKPGSDYLLLGLMSEDDTWGLERRE